MERIGRRALLLLSLCAGSVVPALASQPPAEKPFADPKRFENDIQAYLKSDKETPPPSESILFIGSSIFRQWAHLKEQMTPLPVFNRAFGGSQTNDILYYMDKIVLPYRPKIIVYYCGSNDINDSHQPQGIFDRFKRFSDRVKEALPDTQVYYVSINRAPQKKDHWDWVDAANTLAKSYCETTPKRGYIDVNPALFDAEGKPRMELYQDDRLHFKPEAYVEFTKIIRPVIEKAWKGLTEPATATVSSRA